MHSCPEYRVGQRLDHTDVVAVSVVPTFSDRVFQTPVQCTSISVVTSLFVYLKGERVERKEGHRDD